MPPCLTLTNGLWLNEHKSPLQKSSRRPSQKRAGYYNFKGGQNLEWDVQSKCGCDGQVSKWFWSYSICWETLADMMMWWHNIQVGRKSASPIIHKYAVHHEPFKSFLQIPLVTVTSILSPYANPTPTTTILLLRLFSPFFPSGVFPLWQRECLGLLHAPPEEKLLMFVPAETFTIHLSAQTPPDHSLPVPLTNPSGTVIWGGRVIHPGNAFPWRAYCTRKLSGSRVTLWWGWGSYF